MYIIKVGKVVHISLSPNLERKDVVKGITVFLSFWKWKNGSASTRLKNSLERYFGLNVYLTNSGRSSLYIILKALNIQKGDEVILQAFSCNAVANPILWVGAKPVYADIEEFSYNISAKDIKKKITQNTKAIIIQHSFGIVADISAIKKIAREKRIYLIEDVAHSLGAKHKGKPVGTFGDMALLSFGRDKVISSVYGGAVISKKSYKRRLEKVYNEECKNASIFWIFQQLMHIIFTPVILKSYNIVFGKILLVVLQKIGFISKAVSRKEKKGEMPSHFPRKLPNALAEIAYIQFRRLLYFNNHRQKIAKMYIKGLSDNRRIILPITKDGDIFLRYSIQCSNSSEIIEKAKKENIILGDWYKNVIDPKGTDMKKIKYKKGSCKVAEIVASRVVNLPTHIHTSKQDVEKILNVITNSKNDN